MGRGGRDGKAVRKMPYIFFNLYSLVKSRTAREMDV